MTPTLQTQALVESRRQYRYILMDVFTDTPFAGNPLAVFPDAQSLDGEAMARIARELNLSETVFITDPLRCGRMSIKIFTPGGEIPFAGHPTVGTAWLMRALGLHDGRSPLVIEESVGDIPIHFEGSRARLTTARPLQISECSLTIAQAAEVLGLSMSTIITQPIIASCGVPYHLIEISDLNNLGKVQLDIAALQRILPDPDNRDLYLYVRLPDYQLRTRMFAPAVGIPEDPATGSAAAPLIGYLSGQESFQGMRTWKVIQGIEMDRPSHIHGQVEIDGRDIIAIHISGDAVIIGEGNLYL
ncbi:PhzF family phenazine biosynthesis protein [Salinicola corii]|nr:PhzF family phenazine biosynthesis protein [Salinicola corii]